ncbi:MAG TPA: O-antigen ligase family protein [Thermoanaerobaculia bacterium]|nr:O-antigen ligase family protein [Thermoanaerobaculia bacterium]
MPLVAATAVLWAYIASDVQYKTWYIATAMAMVAVAAVWKRIDTDGLLRATLPVLGYFALLLTTALWAEYPRETLRWVAIDSIEIAVFALFYIAGRNADDDVIANAFASVGIPAAIVALIQYLHDPFRARLAGYSLALLPLVIAFGARRRRTFDVAAMSIAFALLLIGRSRAPLGAALIVVTLAVLTSRERVRTAAKMFGGALAIALLVLAIPATRLMMLTTFGRFMRILPASAIVTRMQSEIRGTPYELQIRPRDQIGVRAMIAERTSALARRAFPFGIGYMNFEKHFEKTYGFPAALHSMYSAWWLEGGVAVTLYVAACAWLLWRHAKPNPSMLIAFAALFFLGAFQQLHQSPALWALLGLLTSRWVCSPSETAPTRARPS